MNCCNMEDPSVKSVFRDPQNNVTVEIFAYRKLKQHEILYCVAELYRKKKRVTKNKTYAIWTIIGYDE